MPIPIRSSAQPDIRRKILTFIKKRGKALIAEVARHFRISHEGARKHLVLMEGHGWVTREESGEPSRGIGRPRGSYTVTSSGDRLFPKAYDRLSIAILSALGEATGAGERGSVRRLLSGIADKQVEAWAPLMRDKGAREKLEILKGLYMQEDPFMSVEARDGDLILVERNCPFLNVALAHPALCSLTVNTLERLLGLPVIREQRFQAGHGRCAFRVRLGRSPVKGDFRFESEASPA